MGATYSSCKTSAEAVTQLTSTVSNSILTENSTVVSSANFLGIFCTEAAISDYTKVCVAGINSRTILINNMMTLAAQSKKTLTDADLDKVLKWIPADCDFCSASKVTQKDKRVITVDNKVTNTLTSTIKMQATQDIDTFMKNTVEGNQSLSTSSIVEASNRVKTFLNSQDFTNIVTTSATKIPGQNTIVAMNSKIYDVDQELATKIMVTNITENIITTNKNIMSDIQSMLDFENEVSGQDWTGFIYALIGLLVAFIATIIAWRLIRSPSKEPQQIIIKRGSDKDKKYDDEEDEEEDTHPRRRRRIKTMPPPRMMEGDDMDDMPIMSKYTKMFQRFIPTKYMNMIKKRNNPDRDSDYQYGPSR